jgi:hypothetical protein
MQIDQALHERQSETEAARRASIVALALDEEVEDAREHRRLDSHPVVPHADAAFAARPLENERNAPALHSVARSIV